MTRPAPATLAALLIVAGAAMLFAGLLYVYWALRLSVPAWPPPLEPRLGAGRAAVNTLVLLASGASVAGALRATRAGDRVSARRRLGASALLAALFLLGQGWEGWRLAAHGVAGAGLFGALAYALIGAHALHATAGVAWLAVARARIRGGAGAVGGMEQVEASALYWVFVVAVWPALFATLYLL